MLGPGCSWGPWLLSGSALIILWTHWDHLLGIALHKMESFWAKSKPIRKSKKSTYWKPCCFFQGTHTQNKKESFTQPRTHPDHLLAICEHKVELFPAKYSDISKTVMEKWICWTSSFKIYVFFVMIMAERNNSQYLFISTSLMCHNITIFSASTFVIMQTSCDVRPIMSKPD